MRSRIGAVYAVANGVVERGQHRIGDAKRRQRLGKKRPAAEQMPQPLLPAHNAALLKLIEGEEGSAPPVAPITLTSASICARAT